jgi:hypothetical protein
MRKQEKQTCGQQHFRNLMSSGEIHKTMTLRRIIAALKLAVKLLNT